MQSTYSFEELVNLSEDLESSSKKNKQERHRGSCDESIQKKVNTQGDIISGIQRRESLLQKLTSCFCIQPETSSSYAEKVVKFDQQQSKKGCRKKNKMQKQSQEKGDTSSNLEDCSINSNVYLDYANRVPEKPPLHPHHAFESNLYEASDSQRGVLTEVETQNNNAGLATKDITHKLEGVQQLLVSVKGDDQTLQVEPNGVDCYRTTSKSDLLDPLMIAAHEVLSASKLLSNAIALLKQYSSVGSVEAKNIDECNRLSELLKTDHSTTLDKLDELPPLCSLFECGVPSVITDDDLYQCASVIVRISIEDNDPIELVKRYTPVKKTDAGRYLVPNEPNRCIKSVFPTNDIYPQSQISVEKQSESLIKPETNSNCQTVLTSTFRIFSTEETQVTEVEDLLTTDESEQSGKQISHLRPASFDMWTWNNAQSDGDHHNVRSQSDQCNKPSVMPRAVPRRTTRPVQSCAAKKNAVNEGKLPEHTQNPKVHSWDEQILPALGKQPSVTVLADQPIGPNGSETEMKPTLSIERSPTCNSRPFPVILDADELSFEVLYQQNNHNHRPEFVDRKHEANLNNSSKGKTESNEVSHVQDCITGHMVDVLDLGRPMEQIDETFVNNDIINVNYNTGAPISTSTSDNTPQNIERISPRIPLSDDTERISIGLRRTAMSATEVGNLNVDNPFRPTRSSVKGTAGCGDDPITPSNNEDTVDRFRTALQIMENHVENARIRNRHSAPNMSPVSHSPSGSQHNDFMNIVDDIYESILTEIHLLFTGNGNWTIGSQRLERPNTGDIQHRPESLDPQMVIPDNQSMTGSSEASL